MQFDQLSLKELIHYGELGEVPGIDPKVATYIREELSSGQDLEEDGQSRQDLLDEISALNETLGEIEKMARDAS